MTALEQSRHLATAAPLRAINSADRGPGTAVARGVGNTMSVYAARAFGGIVEDVDGNRLIDLGSGIAVTT
ncbi:4-aminobutyrate--2-oxoglutarate transaminase, partial [Mycobacterium sp. ITM-2017-0098]